VNALSSSRLDPSELPQPDATAANVHFLTVGTSTRIARNLWDRIAAHTGFRFSHLVHPTYDATSWDAAASSNPVYFMRADPQAPLPVADRALLASLERFDVPTIHNMIMGDRVVSKLPYAEALAYATLLARRFIEVFTDVRPTAIVGDFDALHSALGLAVARRLGIPWFALNFSTIPIDQVGCCGNLTPAALVTLEAGRDQTLRQRARQVLDEFEQGSIRAPAYLPPKLLSPAYAVGRLPAQIRSVARTFARGRAGHHLRFSDPRSTYSVASLAAEAMRLRRNVWRLGRQRLLSSPPQTPFAFIGLHMQPEASIDVFAYFFSNQLRVIELIARSLPPSHTLLVKLHKSDVPNYSPEFLARLRQFPGVQVVAPHAPTPDFIARADLVFAIQGTIGLEAALLGKPVIMFGDSPARVFPSVSTIGRTIDLPALVREKLAQPAPSRDDILSSLALYMAPFYPASGNDWGVAPTETQIGGYAAFFRLVVRHLAAGARGLRGAS
jgi:Capsule polysaccharide biosynthesis protein